MLNAVSELASKTLLAALFFLLSVLNRLRELGMKNAALCPFPDLRPRGCSKSPGRQADLVMNGSGWRRKHE